MERKQDIIVIGGGVSGLGVALEALVRGRRPLLLEKDRCGMGASRGSLRIMHGGFRYLQQLNFPRICESVRAQHELLSRFPEFIKLLPCIMPLSRFGLRSKLPVRFALKFFAFLADRLSAPRERGKVLSSEAVNREIPLLAGAAPFGALLWWDALLLDHQKLIERLMIEIFAGGGTIIEEARVLELKKGSGGYDVYVEHGGTQVFSAPVVISTAGAWLDRARPQSVVSGKRHWTKAFNVIISRPLTAVFGVGTHSHEGRLYFTVPREGGSALGTAYLPFEGDPDQASVSHNEIAEFLASFNRAFPGAMVKMNEVVSVEHGILPTKTADPLSLKGRAEIRNYDGYLEVLSTKYTTFLAQARKVMDLV